MDLDPVFAPVTCVENPVHIEFALMVTNFTVNADPDPGNRSRLPAIVLLIFSCYVQIQLFVAVKSDQDPDPH